MGPSTFLPVALLASLPLWPHPPGAVRNFASLVSQDVDEKSSPFDGLRWSGDQPEVQVDGTWYKPVAIDGIGVDEILAIADTWSPGREKRFAEDLVPILVRLKWKGDEKVDLDLLSLKDGSAVRLEGVEMTRAKRQALRASRNARESSGARRPAPPARISLEEARADIEAFGAGLKDQFAYLGLGEVDLDRELAQIRDGLTGDQADILQLRLELHRLLMRFGDGHAQVRSNLPLGQPGDKCLPFLLVESSAGVVAVLPAGSSFFVTRGWLVEILGESTGRRSFTAGGRSGVEEVSILAVGALSSTARIRALSELGGSSRLICAMPSL